MVRLPSTTSQLTLATACRPLLIDDIPVLLLLVFGSPTGMEADHPPL
jgi:hypothetical protein